MKNQVIVIAGPTASGKTALAMEISKIMPVEIVSADSMQIYRQMNIGTAKPTVEEQQNFPHHLIDVAEPSEAFSVAKYKEMATHCLRAVLSRNHIPVVVGGTGLYINALIQNLTFPKMEDTKAIRFALQKESADMGNKRMMNRLREIDPLIATKIHENDTKRLIRALEIYELTGEIPSRVQKKACAQPSDFQFHLFGIQIERSILLARIEQRVEKMLEEGWVEEVAALIEMGIDPNSNAMQAIGYKEVVDYLSQKVSFDEMKERIFIATRQYAKRQMTWFRRMENICWFDGANLSSNEMAKKIELNLAS